MAVTAITSILTTSETVLSKQQDSLEPLAKECPGNFRAYSQGSRHP